MNSVLHAFLAMAAILAAPAPATAQKSAAPASVPSAPPPNLVLVTVDTCRADHLSCYGYPRPTTPTIDEIAAESLFFERCYSAFSQTTPSHLSIMTGVYPIEHGVLACSFRASEEKQASLAFASTDQLKSVAQLLSAHGYHTGGFVSAATVKRITGVATGFEAWSEPKSEVRPGAETLADGLAWLKTVPEPFFLWLHFFDAHAPPRDENHLYLKEFAPDDVVERVIQELHISPRVAGHRTGGAKVRAADQFATYDAGLRVVDDLVKGLRGALEEKGAWPHTTFVLTGDHGEGLGQHDFLTHALVWSEQVRVPFLIRIPGRAPERIAKVVSTIDVLPTAVTLSAGIPSQELLSQARGRNVLADDFEERPVLSMSPKSQNEQALTTENWRFIRRPDGEDSLFDLRTDPYELHDVKEANAKIAGAFAHQLDVLMKEMRQRRRYFAKGIVNPELTAAEEAEMREALQKLGYVDGEDEEGGRDAQEEGDDDGAGGGGKPDNGAPTKRDPAAPARKGHDVPH